MNYSPIAIFACSRPKHTANLLRTLKKNPEINKSKIFFFIDYPKHINDLKNYREVINILEAFNQNAILIKRKRNLGLKQNIISGINYVLDRYENVIVLEDDLQVSPNFINFINKALNYYKNEKNIISISGFGLSNENLNNLNTKKDFYLNHRFPSWGWATWKSKWPQHILKLNIDELKNDNLTELNKYCGNDVKVAVEKILLNELDAWAALTTYYSYINNLFSLYPTNSLVENKGFDGSGVNGGYSKKISSLKISTGYNAQFTKDIVFDLDIARRHNKYLTRGNIYVFISNLLEILRLKKIIKSFISILFR